jgi:hypothetical protein
MNASVGSFGQTLTYCPGCPLRSQAYDYNFAVTDFITDLECFFKGVRVTFVGSEGNIILPNPVLVGIKAQR